MRHFSRFSRRGMPRPLYDALGRMVEQQSGSATTEILYSPAGKTALMNGQTLTKAFLPLPGGATAIYNSTGLAYYRHSDWIGSSRLTSTQARGLYSSSAYAPFGEQYAVSGASDPSFTGQNSDTASTLYDFTFREHSPSQGRWISPDPAGVAAVDPTNPQTWNRYAYVGNNPVALIDPLGLDDCACDWWWDGGGDGGGGDGSGVGGDPGFWGGIGGDPSPFGDPPGGTTPCPNGPPCQVPGTTIDVNATDGFTPVPGNTSFLACGYLGWCQSANNTNNCQPPFVCNAPNNIPTVSQWRPPKSKDFITAPPGPFKPSVTQCVTAPNDTAEEILGNSVPIEHNPAATGLVYQSTSRGNNPTVSPETVEGANAFAVFFAGYMNMLGCLWNTF